MCPPHKNRLQIGGRKLTQGMIEFLQKCPALQSIPFRIGFLGKEPMCASLSPMPDAKVLRTYTDGDCMMQSTYILQLRLPYGVTGPYEAERILTQLSTFLYDANQQNVFPELPKGNFAANISCTIPDSPKSHTTNSCVFYIPIHITHYSIHKKGLITC